MSDLLSAEFKGFFLLEFTKQLILHSAKQDIMALQKAINTREQKPAMQATPLMPEIIFKPKPLKLMRTAQPQRLYIPEAKLPAHLEYLKPIPSAGVEIDLFKLNPLIRDAAVRAIESNPDEPVIVSGSMGIKPTNIILNKEDIDRVIGKFSEMAKIPTSEGVYRVVVGNLILSAIISEVVGSRFIIKKMAYQIPNQTPPANLPR